MIPSSVAGDEKNRLGVVPRSEEVPSSRNRKTQNCSFWSRGEQRYLVQRQ